ncbi:MAG: hypothetical protein ACYC4H_01855 [Desulfocucumaceae bacterium]
MEGRIKTALEKAMERAQSFPEVSREEIARIENMPRGKTIGASFMNNRNFNLKEALAEIPEEIRRYAVEGVQEILLMNIMLSSGEEDADSTRRAMEGVMAIKRDRAQVSDVLGELDQLMQYYRQAMDQTQERFKKEYETRSRSARAQGRERSMDRMEFREEWANVVRQLNSRFEASLAQLKDRVRNIN